MNISKSQLYQLTTSARLNALVIHKISKELETALNENLPLTNKAALHYRHTLTATAANLIDMANGLLPKRTKKTQLVAAFAAQKAKPSKKEFTRQAVGRCDMAYNKSKNTVFIKTSDNMSKEDLPLNIVKQILAENGLPEDAKIEFIN